jgi:hypothetical protein
MDKEPSIVQLWALGVICGLIGLIAWRWRIIAGLIATLLAIPLVTAFHWELADPYVGPAIRREAGQGYVTQAYLAMGLCFALHVGGAVWRAIRSTRPSMTQSAERG